MEAWRRYVPLAFAVIFAVLSSVSVYYFLKDRSGVSTAAVGQTVQMTEPVVVAKQAIPLGKKLTEEDLKIVPWPANTAPDGSFQTLKALVGRNAKRGLIENEPLVKTSLMGNEESFSALIPAHMRGMTVPVRYSSALAEILTQGTAVDVISMIEPEEGPVQTKVIAQNVRVLAVHKPGGLDLKGGSAPSTMEVTLIVTPRQAESLVTAINKGTIQLVVRSSGEEFQASQASVEWAT